MDKPFHPKDDMAQTDTLADDLREIIADSDASTLPKAKHFVVIDKDLLMQKMVSYIMRRQHRAFNDGVKRGEHRAR